MKLFHKAKDGGPESNVTGYWLVEAKKFLSVALLRFSDGTRDAFHEHAFDSVNWILRGKVVEEHIDGNVVEHRPSWWPVLTPRETFHRVRSEGTTWVFTIRGPWKDTWREYVADKFVTLTHGRKIVDTRRGN